MPEPPVYNPLGSSFVDLESVDSTNNYALALLHAGLAQHGNVFFTRQQTAGKGQRGKIWTAEKDTSLLFSVVIDPRPLQVHQQFQLSACVAVAVHDFFRQYAGDDTRIKWPNDLYWQDRKAGGILVENIIGSASVADVAGNDPKTGISQWKWAVAGIGININQAAFPEALTNAVSLRQVTGKRFSLPELAKEVGQLVDRRFKQLITNGFEEIHSLFNDRLYKANEHVKLKKDNRVFEALIKGVTTEGELIIEHGIEESIRSGDIEWLVPGR